MARERAETRAIPARGTGSLVSKSPRSSFRDPTGDAVVRHEDHRRPNPLCQLCQVGRENDALARRQRELDARQNGQARA
jgi:hypothetical protein